MCAYDDLLTAPQTGRGVCSELRDFRNRSVPHERGFHDSHLSDVTTTTIVQDTECRIKSRSKLVESVLASTQMCVTAFNTNGAYELR